MRPLLGENGIFQIGSGFWLAVVIDDWLGVFIIDDFDVYVVTVGDVGVHDENSYGIAFAFCKAKSFQKMSF
jgi:hypothetical protein